MANKYIYNVWDIDQEKFVLIGAANKDVKQFLNTNISAYTLSLSDHYGKYSIDKKQVSKETGAKLDSVGNFPAEWNKIRFKLNPGAKR